MRPIHHHYDFKIQLDAVIPAYFALFPAILYHQFQASFYLSLMPA